MARALNKLTDTECRASSSERMMSDGGGLYLNVKPSGAKSWAFVWKKSAKRFEMGLGAYPAVRLAQARKLATEYRQSVADGRNPIQDRRKEAEPTFGECADQFLDAMQSQWRNEKHRAQWRMTLTEYADSIRAKAVSEVHTSDVLAILKPLWQSRPETASRLRGRIERVLDYAKAKGWRSGENPALWRGHLKNILPVRQKLTRGHHAAMPFEHVPDFVESLRGKEAMAARALEFLILTAGRSGEVLNATWDEMDLEKAVWTVPADRMKAGKEHRVPLSDRALSIVTDLSQAKVSDYIFAGQKKGRPLSGMSMQMLMRRMKADAYTVHGFRSAFRDWAGDATIFPREVAEHALAHTVGDSTERAYRRADALDKRRNLMAAWAEFLGAKKEAMVIPLRA